MHTELGCLHIHASTFLCWRAVNTNQSINPYRSRIRSSSTNSRVVCMYIYIYIYIYIYLYVCVCVCAYSKFSLSVSRTSYTTAHVPSFSRISWPHTMNVYLRQSLDMACRIRETLWWCSLCERRSIAVMLMFLILLAARPANQRRPITTLLCSRRSVGDGCNRSKIVLCKLRLFRVRIIIITCSPCFTL